MLNEDGDDDGDDGNITTAMMVRGMRTELRTKF